MAGPLIHLTRYSDPAAFAQRAETYLLAREAEHCLLLGICAELVRQPESYPTGSYLATVEYRDMVVLAAIRTPPYPPVLSLPADDVILEVAAELVADDLRVVYGSEIGGIHGPVPLVRKFVGEWRRRTGQASRKVMSERIYQLDAVLPPASVPGAMRRATEADRALLEAWVDAFTAEALLDSVHEDDGAAWVARLFASPQRAAYLWEDPGGMPVSLAAYGSPTQNGIRIGPVYTPPEHRRRGYASALVAALSHLLLDSGRRFCFLFTNLANPTANAIYQAIGYRPVSDVEVYAFINAETEK
jgi:uncharacterized protein